MTSESDRGGLALWQRLWLLVSSIWAVVALLNAATIWFVGDEFERARVGVPLASAVLVPTVLYSVLWAWMRWRSRRTGP